MRKTKFYQHINSFVPKFPPRGNSWGSTGPQLARMIRKQFLNTITTPISALAGLLWQDIYAINVINVADVADIIDVIHRCLVFVYVFSSLSYLSLLKYLDVAILLRNSASSFHWLSIPIFSCLFVRPSRIVTSPLISLKSKNFKKLSAFLF